MTWTPIFEISSKDFEKDVAIFKKILTGFEKQIHFNEGYRFSKEAEFAMGWWFYTIYFKVGFIKSLVEYYHSINPKVKDENGILKMFQHNLKSQGSTARIKFHGQKPFFGGYWTWLLR